MPTLTIKLPDKQLHAAKTRAKEHGFKTTSEWAKFIIENDLLMEESPTIHPSKVISEMRKTNLYKEEFLRGLKKSLEHADKVHQPKD